MIYIKDNFLDREFFEQLELYLKYSNKENERELSIVGHGKWKDINKNEL